MLFTCSHLNNFRAAVFKFFAKVIKSCKISQNSSQKRNNPQKVYIFGVILAHIFTHLILRISPYSVQMRENKDQNNSEYGHFSRSGKLSIFGILPQILRKIFQNSFVLLFQQWEKQVVRQTACTERTNNSNFSQMQRFTRRKAFMPMLGNLL